MRSVLVEAQAGTVQTTQAAPCPLRGFTGAKVVSSGSDAGRLAAAGAVVTAAAGLSDKLQDGDLPRPVRVPARRVAARLDRSGTALSASVGWDPSRVLGASAASAAVEQSASPSLLSLLDPTGAAVASLFAHRAFVAVLPGNGPALAECGRAFGRLVHLLDAVEDRAADRAAGRFNPLEATGTDDGAARELADALVADVQRALSRVSMATAATRRRATAPTGRSATGATATAGSVPAAVSCWRATAARTWPATPAAAAASARTADRRVALRRRGGRDDGLRGPRGRSAHPVVRGGPPSAGVHAHGVAVTTGRPGGRLRLPGRPLADALAAGALAVRCEPAGRSARRSAGVGDTLVDEEPVHHVHGLSFLGMPAEADSARGHAIRQRADASEPA